MDLLNPKRVGIKLIKENIPVSTGVSNSEKSF